MLERSKDVEADRRNDSQIHFFLIILLCLSYNKEDCPLGCFIYL
jgi:hypothetical protein